MAPAEGQLRDWVRIVKTDMSLKVSEMLSRAEVSHGPGGNDELN